MTLAFVTDEEVAQTSATIRVLLYGSHGTGKSTAACSAPAPILYLNADRADGIIWARSVKHRDKDIREVRVKTREAIEQAYLYTREGNDVKTVVFDSLGSIIDHVLRDLAKDGSHPTQPERGDAYTFVERYVEAFLELPVNVILLAHDLPIVVAGQEGESATYETVPFTGTKNPALGKTLMRKVQIVGYTGRVEPDKEGEPPRYVAQLFPGGGRHGKDGTDVVGPVADLDLSAWAKLVSIAFSANGKDAA